VANNLTAYKAANRFAIEGGIRNERLATIMAADYDVQLRKYLLMWKRQFSNGGAMRLLSATDLVTPLL
jgi:hypothetical protein